MGAGAVPLLCAFGSLRAGAAAVSPRGLGAVCVGVWVLPCRVGSDPSRDVLGTYMFCVPFWF